MSRFTSVLLHAACCCALLYFVAPYGRTQAVSKASATWVVRPEWVRAHEEFLASNAMQGRGSATHDEEVAATYVASEFRQYGLLPPPGASGYLQKAGIIAPQLNGHALLRFGDLVLEESRDFTLLTSSGDSQKGPMRFVTAGEAPAPQGLGGSAVALSAGSREPSMEAANALRRTGAVMILVPEDDSTRSFSVMVGGRTRIPMRLAEKKDERSRASVIALTADAMRKVLALQAGTSAGLEVHAVPNGKNQSTFNAIGWLPGSDPAAGTILLTAHLDHLGVGRPVAGDAIYNGANDDAAGTTAVLELAHALAAGAPLRRSVLFVCYGSEETGELGSTYFGAHSPVRLRDLVANLEFEMIGNQDPKMPTNTLLLTGWDRSDLGATLKAHGAALGPDPYPEEHFFERSDNYALALKGVVAHTAAGWGTTPTYHQPNDDVAHLDLPFMTTVIQSLIEPIRWLAMSDFVPKWTPQGQPH